MKDQKHLPTIFQLRDEISIQMVGYYIENNGKWDKKKFSIGQKNSRQSEPNRGIVPQNNHPVQY
jgi:hypothetical protein